MSSLAGSSPVLCISSTNKCPARRATTKDGRGRRGADATPVCGLVAPSPSFLRLSRAGLPLAKAAAEIMWPRP